MPLRRSSQGKALQKHFLQNEKKICIKTFKIKREYTITIIASHPDGVYPQSTQPSFS